ncbi:unnamed protein product [Chironomus riparius]|uniref:Uncharacterized protein n=1 Tax=Chironomus riparius TaxID=315576 RepID=A0A9N9WXR1_9DIPT|nr:unnamed protein product [Chironomus riparius]
MKLDVQEYLKGSPIHGLVYISNGYHNVERIFWSIALSSSTICTLTLIVQLWIKMKSHPIIAYLSDTSVHVSEIYFPAVTVCPDILPFKPQALIKLKGKVVENRFYRYEKNNLSRHYYEDAEFQEEIADENKIGFDYVEILHKIESGEINPNALGVKILKRLQAIDILGNYNIINKLNFSIPADDFLDVLNEFEKQFMISSQPMYFNFRMSQEQYLTEIVTPYGLCFTFNSAQAHDLLDINSTSDDFHFQLLDFAVGSNQKFDLPRKEAGNPEGLNLIIEITNDLSKPIMTREINGYLIILHDPFELPSKLSKSFFINPNQINDIDINLQINEIDESIAEYKPTDRNCYLETEKILKFFKKYTKANCIQECLTDFMINRCSCVEFFMIRNSTTRICSANEKKCIENAKDDFDAQQQSCGCLEPCNHVKYEFEFNLKGVVNPTFTAESYVIQASVQFHEVRYNALIRKQQFNELDFFSYFGGLLGLFAGISVLSLIETVYWFTIRQLESCHRSDSTQVMPFNEDDEGSQPSGIFNSFKLFIVNFFNESSIHGFKFLVGSNYVQRFFWLFFIILSAIISYEMISDVREKIPDSRIVAYDDNFKDFGLIPFPAFTIVPEYTFENEMRNKLIDHWTMHWNRFAAGKSTNITDEMLR